jgi:hypothetical protein
MQPEAKLTRKIRTVFEREGARVFKIQASEESHQEAGIPDLLICLWGQFIGIETKQPGGKLRPLQRVVLHEIFSAGGVAAVVETVEQAESLLSQLKRRSPSEAGLLFYRGDLLDIWPGGTLR